MAQSVAGLWAASGLPDVHFTYMALVVFGLSFCIMTLVSLAAPAPAARPAACFHWSDLKPETNAVDVGWLRDYRAQAAVLALLMVAFIGWFW